VVSGEVTPDNFLVDKVLREVVKREISDKHLEFRPADDGRVHKLPVDEDRRTQPSVADEDLMLVAQLARRAEKHYGCPQDIEWAVDRHLPAGENVVLLQARPETVWSQQAPPSTTANGAKTGMDSIVSTLLSPMHKK
jgi:pyruvate,water dikinase